MIEIATCAVCEEKKSLCNSVRSEGIKQPRVCKECLLKQMAGEGEINCVYWINQMWELKDFESLGGLGLNLENKWNELKKSD